MKTFSISIFLLLFAAFLMTGCSKDEQVAELEKQIQESESEDLLQDTTTEVEVTEQPAVQETKTYTKTPETAPREEKAPSYMPKHTGTGQYTVQVASGSNPEWIKIMADTYIRRGYEAFITETNVDGETFYRLRIGSYDEFSEAKAVGLELQDKYSANFWIDYNE
ncbi:MAG: SPOR domain-containing protein [Candidatus Zixiibacteriota bacterium]